MWSKAFHWREGGRRGEGRVGKWRKERGKTDGREGGSEKEGTTVVGQVDTHLSPRAFALSVVCQPDCNPLSGQEPAL